MTLTVHDAFQGDEVSTLRGDDFASPAPGLAEPRWWPSDAEMDEARGAISGEPAVPPSPHAAPLAPPAPVTPIMPGTPVTASPAEHDPFQAMADWRMPEFDAEASAFDNVDLFKPDVPPAAEAGRVPSFAPGSFGEQALDMFAPGSAYSGGPQIPPASGFSAPAPAPAPQTWMPTGQDVQGEEYTWNPAGQGRSRGSTLLMAGAGVVLLAGVGTAALLLFGGSGGKSQAQTSQSAIPAVSVPASMLEAYQAQTVSAAVFGGQLRVSWQAPAKPQDVAGYIVVAQTATGQSEARNVITNTDMSTVFSMPPVSSDACVVVTTLVKPQAGQTALQLAQASPVCLNGQNAAGGSPEPSPSSSVINSGGNPSSGPSLGT